MQFATAVTTRIQLQTRAALLMVALVVALTIVLRGVVRVVVQTTGEISPKKKRANKKEEKDGRNELEEGND